MKRGKKKILLCILIVAILTAIGTVHDEFMHFMRTLVYAMGAVINSSRLLKDDG